MLNVLHMIRILNFCPHCYNTCACFLFLGIWADDLAFLQVLIAQVVFFYLGNAQLLTFTTIVTANK